MRYERNQSTSWNSARNPAVFEKKNGYSRSEFAPLESGLWFDDRETVGTYKVKIPGGLSLTVPTSLTFKPNFSPIFTASP